MVVQVLCILVALFSASLSFGSVVYTYNGNALDTEYASWSILYDFIGSVITIDFTLPEGTVLADYLNMDLVSSGVAVTISDIKNSFSATSAVISSLDAWSNPLAWDIRGHSTQVGGNFSLNWDLSSVSSATSVTDRTQIFEPWWGATGSGADVAYRYNTNSPGVWSHVPPEVVPVPEPSAFLLLGAGLGGIALLRRRSLNM